MNQPHPLENATARWAAFADGLGLSEEPLRNRLRDEYAATLSPVVDETIERLPDQVLSDQLRELDERLTAVPHETMGSIAASIDAMDDAEVYDIANRLLEIGHVVGAYAMRVYEDR